MIYHHTIRVTETLEALGAELSEFTADIAVNWHGARGDGWNEPREPAFGALVRVTQVDGPFIHPLKLTMWADLWVEANQHRIADEVHAAIPF